MCGIAGIVTSSGRRIDPQLLGDMIAMIDHRGPDERGVHVDQFAALAHARLSIIDPAGGRQPMSNEDGSRWITFNGEIFNFVELREELIQKGHRFRTRSDTEVLLRLYEEEGPEAVQKLNGQWAFGLWDARERMLFLSRDLMGVRPVFYTILGDTLLFASEIKALFAHPHVSRDLDPEGLDNIFSFWATNPPRTAFRNIRELPPGHSLIWHDGQIDVSRHWRQRYAPEAPGTRSEHEYRDTLRRLLSDATRLRLRSDVPVGAYLSGGLDSSIITALVQRVSEAPLRTFSIAFDDPDLDESAHQRQLVEALHTQHTELRCSSDEIADAFPDVVWHAEQPLVRTAPVPMFLLSRLVCDSGYKVVLTGEGADEMFGGYDIFKEAKVRRFWARFPSSSRRASLVRRLYPYLKDLQRQPLPYLQSFFHVTQEDLANPFFSHLPRWGLTSRLKLFFSDDVLASLDGYDGYADLAAQLPPEYDDWDPFCQAQYLESSLLLPGYILSAQGDRPAMAHGVEGRYPFLDPNVMNFASSLPPAMKMKVLNEKHLLKLVARDLVPAPVWKRSKQPYRAPDGKVFFTGKRHDYVDDLLSAAQVRKDGIFKPEAVDRLVRKFRDGRGIGLKDNMALVAILSTQVIMDRFINNFRKVTHAGACAGSTALHRR